LELRIRLRASSSNSGCLISLQRVDIALRAISPAVNDPTTAIGCIDQLSRILIRVTSREQPEPLLYDLRGVARVSISWIDFERLLDSAFGQIRLYAQNDIAVSLRLLRALGDIAITTQDAGFQKSLLDEGQRVVAGCSQHLGTENLQPLVSRLSTLKKLAVK
jgi:uncharacterized membrane protein